jgi:hypothetical protein
MELIRFGGLASIASMSVLRKALLLESAATPRVCVATCVCRTGWGVCVSVPAAHLSK